MLLPIGPSLIPNDSETQKIKPGLDKVWANRAFLVPEKSLSDKTDEYRRYFTSSSRKFTSAAIGGHYVVNPIPQFTANCDIPHAPFYEGGIDSPSRWWSEKLDDSQQIIHFRPGVMKFNNLTTFFGNFYNVEAGAIARTGRSPGVMYTVGRVLGTVGSLPLQPFILGGAAWRFFFNMPRSKYYYLSPTSYPYRYAVQTMMNAIMANEGMIAGSVFKEVSQFYDESLHPGEVDIETINKSYGDALEPYGFINKYGAVDIFAISTSAQRLAGQFRKKLEEQLTTDTVKWENTYDGGRVAVTDAINRVIAKGIEDNLKNLKPQYVTLEEYEKEYQKLIGNPTADTDDDKAWENTSLNIPPVDPVTDKSAWDKFVKFTKDTVDQFASEGNRAADFVSFRVNWTGSQSESFSNQSGESGLEAKVNGISSRAREIRFNAADGNVVGGPLGKIIGAVTTGVKDVIAGALDSVKLSGAIALAGNAFADIQKMYQSSSADLNRTSFTIHLRSWSSDPWVRLTNLWMPLCHLLPLGMPRATGPGSYDGPFLVEVINQGKTLIREGLIESINIERGVGDVGFGRNKEVLGIDITVTVADMSSIMSVPINAHVGALASAVSAGIGTVISGGAGLAGSNVDGVAVMDTALATLNKSTYSEDNKYTDYIATITSLPLNSIIDPKTKWRLRMSRMRSEMASNRTAANFGSSLFDDLPGEFVKVVFGHTKDLRW